MPSWQAVERGDAVNRTGQVAAALIALLVLAIAAVEAGGTSHKRYAARAAAADVSSNWAGYAVTSANPSTPISFTSVTGTWTQTTANCTGNEASSASAFWVGLGGYDVESQALEQIGTDADCSASGQPSYYAWWELVPDPPSNLKLKIRPGDTITASVNVSGNLVWLQLKNRTTGAVFNKKVSINAPDISSAEWIAEAPSSCSGFSCRPVPLANFGSVSFTKIATTGNGHPGTLTDPTWIAAPIQLVPRARSGFFPGDERGLVQTVSTAGTGAPQGLTADGRSFTLSWLPNAAASGP
jgi:hypothetical protein